VGGDACDVLHQLLRLLEDGRVETLEDVAGNRSIGTSKTNRVRVVDMTSTVGPNVQALPHELESLNYRRDVVVHATLHFEVPRQIQDPARSLFPTPVKETNFPSIHKSG